MWLVNGANHKGSHFPICVFTQNTGHRSRRAKIIRGRKSTAEQAEKKDRRSGGDQRGNRRSGGDQRHGGDQWGSSGGDQQWQGGNAAWWSWGNAAWDNEAWDNTDQFMTWSGAVPLGNGVNNTRAYISGTVTRYSNDL